MERLRNRRSSGLNASNLRSWGIVFLTLGAIGRGLLQRLVMGTGNPSMMEVVEAMQSSSSAMLFATLSLLFQAAETCALPIFAFLLTEGFKHTKSYKNYLLRVAGLAVVTEIPYNLTVSGQLLDLSSRNPVFSLVLALVVLYFFQRYAERSLQNFLVKLLVLIAGILWSGMLQIESGVCMVLVTAILWLSRKNALYRNLAGTVGVLVCILVSPFYLAAPMGFLLIHFYNEERGSDNRLVSYLSYPVILLAIGLIAMFIA